MSETKVDVRTSECWVTWKEIGFGITAFFAISPRHPSPVATVFGLFSGAGQGGKRRMEIMGSYVVPWARRQGVRTRINEAIFEEYGVDVIVTQMGTDEGGEAFMRASGYRIEPRTGVWYLRRPKAVKR